MECRKYNSKTISQYLFLIGLFFKQFYILPSGSFQVGDLFIGISFVFFIVFDCKCKLIVLKTEKLFLVFFYFVKIINFIYSVLLRDSSFNRSSLYYLYNVLVVIMFSFYLNQKSNNDWFYMALIRVIQFSFIVQGIILILGLGKWYGGGTRYLGTFNDPNQYGVFILMNIFLVYLLGKIVNKKMFVWIMIGSALIIPSASTGMLIGLGTFVILYIIGRLVCEKNRVRLLIWIGIVMLMIVIALLMMNGYVHFPKTIVKSEMLDRFQIKFMSMRTSKSSIITDRGWERIFEFPEYLLFGAGEGGHARFGTILEIHSSILAPLFYYGIIPWIILICWYISKIKGMNVELLCVYIALALESLLLVNTRQPLFWILILLAAHPSLKRFQSKDF